MNPALFSLMMTTGSIANYPPLPKNPWVSIVTPVFNGIEFIEQSIQSVVKQTYPLVEQVFVDGGSTDGTLDVLKKYHQEHPDRIRWFPEKNPVAGRGPGNAWNQGLREARGEILGWLGSDDLLGRPESAQQVVQFFQSNPFSFFVNGHSEIIDEQGKLLTVHQAREFDMEKLLNRGNYVSWPSSFYRKEVIEAVGALDSYGNDFEYLIRIARQFPIHKIDAVLSKFRKHDGSETGSLRKLKRVIEMDFRISRNYGGRLLSHYGRRYIFYRALDTLRLVGIYGKLKKRIKGF